jgi:hypothetical protein
MGRLSTLGLPIKAACFVKKINKIFNGQNSQSKLVSTRRSTVLSLSPQYSILGKFPFLVGELLVDGMA